MDNLIELKSVSKTFKRRDTKEELQVLKEINLSIEEGSSIGLIGKSGSGKSTITKIILRLLKPDRGEVLFKGQNIYNLDKKKLKVFRKSVQLISQRPESSFDPSMRVINSLKEPLKAFKEYDKIEFEKSLDEKLETVKLKPGLLSRYPHQLSGGEIQRFAIIRALFLEPEILILDECTSMLDISVQAQILQLLKMLKEKENLTYLIISHDLDVINFMCDKVYKLEYGELKRYI